MKRNYLPGSKSDEQMAMIIGLNFDTEACFFYVLDTEFLYLKFLYLK